MDKLPSISELKSTTQPDPKKEKVWYAKYVIRKISVYFTWLLLHTPLTANQATFIQTFLGIAGAVLLAFGGYKWSLWAMFLIQLGYIFDCVDGEIARYRKKSSVNGIFLDSINHAVVIPFIFLGLTVFSYSLTQEIWILYIGLVLVIISGDPVKKGMLSTLFYMLERRDNPKYQFANMTQDTELQSVKQETIIKKKSLLSVIEEIAKDISEYPTSMNIITLIVVADFIIHKYADWQYYPLSFYLVILYSVFLVLKELYFFKQVYKKRDIEKKYIRFIH